MGEENIPQVEEKCCLDDNNPKSMPLMDVVIQEDDHVLPLLPATSVSNLVKLRRYSTGVSDKLVPGKAQTRYRGNQMSSTHDLCKHGKRREDDLVKSASLGVMRKSLGSVTKPEKSLVVAKRDASASDVVKSCDGLRVKTIKSTTPSDAMVKKTILDAKKVLRSSEKKSSKVDPLKNLKNKEKAKTDEPVKCEDVLEKTLYVVESNIEEKKKKSIKSAKSETQQSIDKKILRSNQRKSLALLPSLIPSLREVKEPRLTKSDPRPIRQSTSKSKTSLSEKKETGSANFITNLKTESKIRPKKIGLKATPPPPRPPQIRPLSFKKGKVLEPKLEDSTPTLIKFKKRVQEPKLRSDVNKKKKNLKDKGEGVGKISYTNSEGKREKVVLRHRKVEAKKKLQTLFNNVIEETVNKLEEVRKSKVKALVGAFETVISLQDNDRTSQKKKKVQSKSTLSQVVES